MKDIKGNSLKGIYLFYGEEELLSKMMLDHVKKALIETNFYQMNVNELDGGSIDAQEIINACETLPFMSQKRLVIIKGSKMFNSNQVSNADIDLICKYLINKSNSTHIIFVNRNIDKKRKIYKTIQKQGEIVEYSRLNNSDLIKWINKRVNLQGKKINSNAIQTFIEHSDYLNKDSKATLYDIDNEIDKLIAYAKDIEIIEKQEVLGVVKDSLDSNIFKLLELMGNGANGEALQLVDVLVKNGESPVKILYMMIRQFRLMYHSKVLKDKGFSSGDIPNLMSERPFVVQKVIGQGRHYSQEQLNNAYQFLAEMDLKIKSSKIDPRLAIELLISKFN